MSYVLLARLRDHHTRSNRKVLRARWSGCLHWCSIIVQLNLNSQWLGRHAQIESTTFLEWMAEGFVKSYSICWAIDNQWLLWEGRVSFPPKCMPWNATHAAVDGPHQWAYRQYIKLGESGGWRGVKKHEFQQEKINVRRGLG